MLELEKVLRNIALLKKYLKLFRTLNLMDITKAGSKSYKCNAKQKKVATACKLKHYFKVWLIKQVW